MTDEQKPEQLGECPFDMMIHCKSPEDLLRASELIAERDRHIRASDLTLVPVTLREARAFCGEHHRHNVSPKAHKFSIGLAKSGELIGVAIVGRPTARRNDDGLTAEILRVCVLEGSRNANSKLYGACVRACKAMGYTKVITYTLLEESGASLRAAGFIPETMAKRRAKGWDTPSRRREKPEKYPEGQKIRWYHE